MDPDDDVAPGEDIDLDAQEIHTLTGQHVTNAVAEEMAAEAEASGSITISVARYNAMIEELEDLKDRLSVHERTGDTVSAQELTEQLRLQRDHEQRG